MFNHLACFEAADLNHVDDHRSSHRGSAHYLTYVSASRSHSCPEPNLDSTIGQYRQLSSDRMACDSTKACSGLSDPFHAKEARSVDITNFVMHLHSLERRHSVMKKTLWR